MAIQIPWWSTKFSENEIASVARSIRSGHVSQGVVTARFESAISELLGVKHVVAVSNGTSALTIALMAIGLKPGDEVIIPNRTWVATAHAVKILGGNVVTVDVESDRPIMDWMNIEKAISPKTRAIIPVHMNGRAANMINIKKIAAKYRLYVIEDAAQALYSKYNDDYLGTIGDIGCFSLSAAKIISTGQSGFVVTKNSKLANRIRAIRTHGLENIIDANSWVQQGFNFRFTDVLASIGVEQIKLIDQRAKKMRRIYDLYAKKLRHKDFELIPVDVNNGEIPLYTEYLVNKRNIWAKKLMTYGIETRSFYPNISETKYLEVQHIEDKNSTAYSQRGLYLPSGPNQKMQNIERTIKIINELQGI